MEGRARWFVAPRSTPRAEVMTPARGIKGLSRSEQRPPSNIIPLISYERNKV